MKKRISLTFRDDGTFRIAQFTDILRGPRTGKNLRSLARMIAPRPKMTGIFEIAIFLPCIVEKR